METNSRFIPDWNNILSDGRNELVFEGRNKGYGAYVIRRDYNRIVITALMIAVTTVILIVGIPILVRLIEGVNLQTNDTIDYVNLNVLPPPPPVNQIIKPLLPLRPSPPPSVLKTIKNTPPKVTNEKVIDPPPSQKDLDKTAVGLTTHDGKDSNLLPTLNTVPGIALPAPQKPFVNVQQMPVFPGGIDKMFEYLQNNVNYPQVEKEEGVSGAVYVSFVIGSDGKVQDVKILSGIANGPGCNKEALRVVSSMPNWTPGKQDGRAVPVQYSLPIKFVLR